jgi:hypothetical protein
VITTYIIETWNPILNKYQEIWKGSNFEMAEKMFNKPYYKRHTRRLRRIQDEILYKEKGSERWSTRL